MDGDAAEFKYKDISVSWDRGDGYLGQNQAGARIALGKPQEGTSIVSPTEAMLMGLAACTAIDIIDILRKKRQLPTDLKVRVRGKQRVDGFPKPFVEFQVEYLVWGENLKPKDVGQAVHLSEQKYCSVGATLMKSGSIHSTFRILKPGEEADQVLEHDFSWGAR